MEGKHRKIGIMGGTFDPIHISHLILGEKAYEQLGLDEVWFMPAGNPPHKKDRPGRASDEERIEMVRLAIEGNPHFVLSLAEMHEEGYSYTYRTLEKLTADNPDTEYFFIIGADSLFSLETWREPARILKTCTMVVASRNAASAQELDREMQRLSEQFHGSFLRLDTLNMDVSSATLREWIKEGKSIRYYTPAPVMDYILQHHIYQ
ncbi:MAG: nicotinate-nucleotide adenylyltransferase [Eubacteriales bacterium]|nr:nicotinate-nucleotide adenylyltransferase [Eubacteriales bacterium]